MRFQNKLRELFSLAQGVETSKRELNIIRDIAHFFSFKYGIVIVQVLSLLVSKFVKSYSCN